MADSPTGTVTFLFTDIQGSTAMWEQNPKAMSDALALQGWASLQEGDTRRAWMLLVESLEGYLEAESRVGVIDSLVDVGAVAGARGEPLRAARLWGAADALRKATGYTMSVREARMYEPYMSAARSELGETAFLAAWEEGRAMTEEQAIALAFENEENDANLEETEPK